MLGPNDDGAEAYREHLESIPCPTCGAKESDFKALRTERDRLLNEGIEVVHDLHAKLDIVEAENKRLKGYLCRAKMTLLDAATFLEAEPEGAKEMIAEIRNIWKEVGPCSHWAEVTRIREVIEWACIYAAALIERDDNWRFFYSELRRLAYPSLEEHPSPPYPPSSPIEPSCSPSPEIEEK